MKRFIPTYDDLIRVQKEELRPVKRFIEPLTEVVG